MSTIKEEAIKLRENIDAVYEAGKAAGGGSGGEDYLQYVVSIYGLFQYCEFPTDTELELYLPMLFTKPSLANIINHAFFNAKGLKSVKLKCDVRDVPVSWTNMFHGAISVKIIDLTEFNTMVSNFVQSFMGCAELEEIKGEFDFSQCTGVNAPFHSSPNLIEVRFKANTLAVNMTLSQCPKLSDVSIQSIIDGLADLTGGTAQTVSWHSTVLDKLTVDQVLQITNKNWNYN